MNSTGRDGKQTRPQDGGLKNPAQQHPCPVCGKVLGLARWSSNGTQFGCRDCGNWFQSDALLGEESPISRTESPRVSKFSPSSIIMPLKSATLTDAVDELVPKALHGAGDIILRSAKIAENLKKGLNLRSAEYHPGLAFLHHRLKDLPGRRMALGIAPDGLQPEGNVETRIFVVALFLKPLREPGYDIPSWARRTLCNDKTIYKLRIASDTATVLKLLEAA